VTTWAILARGSGGKLPVGSAPGLSARPRRLPDGVPRGLEIDQDLGELGADRLVLDDAAAALDADAGVVHRRLEGGAADAEIDRLGLRQAEVAAGAGQRVDRLRARACCRPAPCNP
jgi:hypothetical protein